MGYDVMHFHSRYHTVVGSISDRYILLVFFLWIIINVTILLRYKIFLVNLYVYHNYQYLLLLLLLINDCDFYNYMRFFS